METFKLFLKELRDPKQSGIWFFVLGWAILTGFLISVLIKTTLVALGGNIWGMALLLLIGFVSVAWGKTKLNEKVEDVETTK